MSLLIILGRHDDGRLVCTDSWKQRLKKTVLVRRTIPLEAAFNAFAPAHRQRSAHSFCPTALSERLFDKNQHD